MDTVLSILMLAAIAMVAGAIMVWRKGGPRKQVILMLVLAAVMAANVAIWVWPGPDGAAPPTQALR